MAEIMTRADRTTLISIAKKRERLAKSEAKARSAQLMADFEQQLDRRYSFDENSVWEAATKLAEAAVADAKQQIANECERLGIPKEMAPSLHMNWYDRGRNATSQQRVEMRRLAGTQIEALQNAAISAIERQSLETQEKIMVGGLSTDDARLFLEAMPSAQDLMPELTMENVDTLRLSGPAKR